MKTIKRPLAEKVVVFRAYARDVDLLRLASEQKAISMSDFCRQALRKEAGRVLACVENTAPSVEREAVG